MTRDKAKSLGTLTQSFLAALLATCAAHAGSYRSIDGSGNNLANPAWGQAGEQLLRTTSSAYDDGISVPRGGDPSSLPSARAISNAVAAQSTADGNSVGASDWLWQWGQFLDHDLDLTPSGGTEAFNIPVPQGDPHFDPFNTGTQEIGMTRSIFDPATGTTNPRQQPNEITSYIDASNVYGSDTTRAATLRDASGRMLTSAGDLLPYNTFGLPNDNGPAGGPDAAFFAAGDPRANEQVGLTAAHTLFVREHNRLVDDLEARLAGGDSQLIAKRDAAITEPGNGVDDQGDFLYESARKVVGAQMQKITYEEFLPLLMGSPLTPSAGYDDTVNAAISTEFSSAAFRVGHTMLSPDLQLVNYDNTSAGSLSLQASFFTPSTVATVGVDSILGGLARQEAQEIDTRIIDDVRNFLFGPPGAGGFDLASLNLQRGREHGLDDINSVRAELQLTPHANFLDLTGGDATLAAAFANVYSSVDEVDLWIGGLAEAHVGGGLLGETFAEILGDQFTRSRDGDRFFYEFDLEHLLVLDPDFESTLLSDIIRRNTDLEWIQSNVFYAVPEPGAAMLLVSGLALRFRRRT